MNLRPYYLQFSLVGLYRGNVMKKMGKIDESFFIGSHLSDWKKLGTKLGISIGLVKCFMLGPLSPRILPFWFNRNWVLGPSFTN
jgi:hypothetical protein